MKVERGNEATGCKDWHIAKKSNFSGLTNHMY
jgi:hypothetical protein